jgi:hypothetical protein
VSHRRSKIGGPRETVKFLYSFRPHRHHAQHRAADSPKLLFQFHSEKTNRCIAGVFDAVLGHLPGDNVLA